MKYASFLLHSEVKKQTNVKQKKRKRDEESESDESISDIDGNCNTMVTIAGNL